MMNPLARAACTIHVLMLGALAARAQTPLAVPVEGKPFRAELTAADAKWRLQFRSGDRPRMLPAAELVRWGSYVETARGPIVVLADGGLLAAEVTGADKETLQANSQLFGKLKLPLELLSGAVFNPPATRHRRDLLLDRVARATGESDRLLLTNGDELAGLVEAIDQDAVTLETDVGRLKIEIDRVAALVFNPDLKQEAEHQGLRAWAGFSDGSRLIATRLAVKKQGLTITPAPAQTWKTAPKELVCLQPLGGRVTYLSDLKAAGYRHLPFLSLKWPYRLDRNVTGARLRCGGRLYLKGLGTHSAAQLTYGLSQPYRRFQAELGIDDSTQGSGSVRFSVLVDGRRKYASQTIRGGDAPVPVSVDVTGGKRLELIVDFAERADQWDHANWLNARLVK